MYSKSRARLALLTTDGWVGERWRDFFLTHAKVYINAATSITSS